MPTLTFEPVTHVYALDGQLVPSVTQILGASGLIDFGGIPLSILAAARDRGQAVHQAIHYYNEQDLDVDRFCAEFPDYAGYLQGWIAFRRQRAFTPALCERRVASPTHRYAGTIDCLGAFDGAGALLDFKTGDPDDVAADLQTAAYLGAAYEWAAQDPELARFLETYKVVRRYSVRLRKDARFTIETYGNPHDLTAFRTLVAARHVVAARKGEFEAWLREGAA